MCGRQSQGSAMGAMNRSEEKGRLDVLPDEDIQLRVTEPGCDPLGSVYVSGELHGEADYHEAVALLRDLGATPVYQDLFGPREALGPYLGHLESAPWPTNCVTAVAPDGPVSTQIHAVRNAKVTRLLHEGHVAASLYEDESATYCRAAGILPRDAGAVPEIQAGQVFDSFSQILSKAGMAFTNVTRTWFYNDRILDWYAGFNRARDAYYRPAGLFQGIIPASTGIGGGNPAGMALSGGFLAVAGKTEAVRRQVAVSPLQDSALAYGSTFSRAVAMRVEGREEVLVSGTASITPDGKTAHLNDVPAQISLTMDVVAAILDTRGMDWSDVSRAIAYVPDAAFLEDFRVYLDARGLTDLPLIETVNTVCRGDLLFEIELDAIRRAD